MQEVLGFARRRGWRLNLRPLAEMQTLVWLFVLIMLGRWVWALVSSEGGLFGLDEEYYQELAAAGQPGTPGTGYQQPPYQQHHPHWQQRQL